MKVSVCIPTFNQDAFIENAIRSVLDQTFSVSEIIVSNDCSTDSTAALLEELKHTVPGLIVVHQPYNLGISKNTDFCLRLASGEFVVRLDSDDYLARTYVETLVKLIESNSNIGYAHAAVQEIDSDGNFRKQRRLNRTDGLQTGDHALRAAVSGFKVAANIIMFRKAALEKVGYIANSTNFAEDYYLLTSISAAGFSNVYRDEILAYYRVWVDKEKVRQKRKLDEIVGCRKVFLEVMYPAFRLRNWDLRKLEIGLQKVAYWNADCLGWKHYTTSEKMQLKSELLTLSNSHKIKLVTWVHLNGLGGPLLYYSTLKSLAKSYTKTLLLALRRRFKSSGI